MPAAAVAVAAAKHLLLLPPHLVAANHTTPASAVHQLDAAKHCCWQPAKPAHLKELLIQIQKGAFSMLCPACECVYLILILAQKVACCCAALCC
jgi:hypothetical protein